MTILNWKMTLKDKNYESVIYLVVIGLCLILVESSIRCILGFIIIVGTMIAKWFVLKGNMLMSVLFMISICSMAIIIFILQYNSYLTTTVQFRSRLQILTNLSQGVAVLVVLTIYFVSFYSGKSSSKFGLLHSFIKMHDSIGVLSIGSLLESNHLISTLVLLLVICISVMSIAQKTIVINASVSYISVMNIFIVLVIALIICYIPLFIRYQSNIYKWYKDIYETGVGVNMSNSISNLNLGIFSSFCLLLIYHTFLLISIIILLVHSLLK
jgi:hypothetical protein